MWKYRMLLVLEQEQTHCKVKGRKQSISRHLSGAVRHQPGSPPAFEEVAGAAAGATGKVPRRALTFEL